MVRALTHLMDCKVEFFGSANERLRHSAFVSRHIFSLTRKLKHGKRYIRSSLHKEEQLPEIF